MIASCSVISLSAKVPVKLSSSLSTSIRAGEWHSSAGYSENFNAN